MFQKHTRPKPYYSNTKRVAGLPKLMLWFEIEEHDRVLKEKQSCE